MLVASTEQIESIEEASIFQDTACFGKDCLYQVSTPEKNPYLQVTAMVIGWQPMGEYDRRVVLLTRERGKISAFAKGARRPGSSLLAATDIFCFGTFFLYEGRSSYTIREASVSHYFEYFRSHLESALTGQYFLEVMEYCTRENNDESSLLALLYQSLRALESPAYPDPLVVSIFEIRTVAEEGELPVQFQPEQMNKAGYQDSAKDKKTAGHMPEESGEISDAGYSAAVIKAMQVIITSPISHLYSFRLGPAAQNELQQIAGVCMDTCFEHHHFKSKEILREMGYLTTRTFLNK